jgi:hypothetical protein
VRPAAYLPFANLRQFSARQTVIVGSAPTMTRGLPGTARKRVTNSLFRPLHLTFGFARPVTHPPTLVNVKIESITWPLTKASPVPSQTMRTKALRPAG